MESSRETANRWVVAVFGDDPDVDIAWSLMSRNLRAVFVDHWTVREMGRLATAGEKHVLTSESSVGRSAPRLASSFVSTMKEEWADVDLETWGFGSPVPVGVDLEVVWFVDGNDRHGTPPWRLRGYPLLLELDETLWTLASISCAELERGGFLAGAEL